MSNEYETLRWPTNMDRDAIVAKLVSIREAAHAGGQGELAAFFHEYGWVFPDPTKQNTVAALVGLRELNGANDLYIYEVFET